MKNLDEIISYTIFDDLRKFYEEIEPDHVLKDLNEAFEVIKPDDELILKDIGDLEPHSDIKYLDVIYTNYLAFLENGIMLRFYKTPECDYLSILEDAMIFEGKEIEHLQKCLDGDINWLISLCTVPAYFHSGITDIFGSNYFNSVLFCEICCTLARKSGCIRFSNGNRYNADGSIDFNDNTHMNPDGSAILSDGSKIKDPNEARSYLIEHKYLMEYMNFPYKFI